MGWWVVGGEKALALLTSHVVEARGQARFSILDFVFVEVLEKDNGGLSFKSFHFPFPIEKRLYLLSPLTPPPS